MREVRAESLLVAGGSRRRGRPRVEHPLAPVMTRVPVLLYDQLTAVVLERGEPLSAVVRSLLCSSIGNKRNQ